MHPYRTHTCGNLKATDRGEEVRLSGVVDHVRDLGKLAFLSFHDFSGTVQIVADNPTSVGACRKISTGSLITVTGKLRLREKRNIDSSTPNGDLEISLHELTEITSLDNASVKLTGVRSYISKLRQTLNLLGLIEIQPHDSIPLTSLLLEHDRVFRLQPQKFPWLRVPKFAREFWCLEIELAFATIEELFEITRSVFESINRPLGTILSWEEVDISTEAESSSPYFDPSRSVMAVHSLPIYGDPYFCGYDKLLTLTASEKSRDDGSGKQSLCDAVLFMLGDRIAGAASVRTTSPSLIRNRLSLAPSNDPSFLADVDRYIEKQVVSTPPHAGVILNLGLLDGNDDVEANERDFSKTQYRRYVQIHDLASLLKVQHREHRLAFDLDDRALEQLASRLTEYDMEGSAALIRSRALGQSAAGHGSPFEPFQDILADFSMTSIDCDMLLDLDPKSRERCTHLPPGERFQWIWSLLGNDFVREIVRDPASYSLIRQAMKLGVINNLEQLVYVDQGALCDLFDVLHRFEVLNHCVADSASPIVILLRRVLGNTPAAFTSILVTLLEFDENTFIRCTDGENNILRDSASYWLSSPVLFSQYFLHCSLEIPLSQLKNALFSVRDHVFQNSPFHVEEMKKFFIEAVHTYSGERFAKSLETSSAASITASLLHHYYRPVNMSFRAIVATLGKVQNCCSDVDEVGLRTGGLHWDTRSGCYRFPGPVEVAPELSGLCLYLSKSAASFFAKSSVGICTNTDLGFFLRKDHHHLNVVDGVDGYVVGNAQLHIFKDRGQSVLLIRSINASQNFLKYQTATALVEAVFLSCTELAYQSNLDEVHLSESLSYWHLNSSRSEIRAVLETRYREFEVVQLEHPFPLFTFGKVRHEVWKTYRLWRKSDREQGKIASRMGDFV